MVTRLTGTVIASIGVVAVVVTPTIAIVTLVNVNTGLSVIIEVVTMVTEALVGARQVEASMAAIPIITFIDVDTGVLIRSYDIARRAATPVATISVDTVVQTDIEVLTFVPIDAISIGMPHVAFGTEALITALSVYAIHVARAGVIFTFIYINTII